MPILQEKHFSLFWDQAGSLNNSRIMMLHGLASPPHFSFLSIEDELSKHYWIISPHLPGQGENIRLGLSNPKKEFTMSYPEATVEILLSLLDSLNIERIPIIGYSLGGLISVVLAALAPSRVEKLVLMAPGLDGNRAYLMKEAEVMSKPGLLKNMPRDTEPWVRALIRYYGSNYTLMGEALSLLYNYGFFDSWCETARRLVPRVTAETLLIHGKEDKVVPLSVSQWLHEHLPKSRLHIIPSVGHGLHNDSTKAATEIANLIRTFISGE